MSDVAERAGVSLKTVSNVVNGQAHVSEKLSSRVEQAIQELGYRPNPSARALASQRSGFIMLAIPTLTNPYYVSLATHVFDAAAARGWTVLVEQTRAVKHVEREILGGAGAQLADGVILQPSASAREDITDLYNHPNLVLIGEDPSTRLADSVVMDNVLAAEQVANHLIERSRRKIATIGIAEAPTHAARGLRFEGLSGAVDAAGLELVPERLRSVRLNGRKEGYEAAQRLMGLRDRPDAIVCFNDLLAVGALAALRDLDIRVPDDVAVVGFDDIAESEFTGPSLTSVAWDQEALAEACVARLAEGLKGAPGPTERDPQVVEVEHWLVVRGSS